VPEPLRERTVPCTSPTSSSPLPDARCSEPSMMPKRASPEPDRTVTESLTRSTRLPAPP